MWMNQSKIGLDPFDVFLYLLTGLSSSNLDMWTQMAICKASNRKIIEKLLKKGKTFTGEYYVIFHSNWTTKSKENLLICTKKVVFNQGTSLR